MPTVYSSKIRKARTTHLCYECCGIIRKGEYYKWFSGKWDGEFTTYKICTDCKQLRIAVDAHIRDFEERTPFGGLLESCCESNDAALLRRYVEIRISRDGPSLPDWLIRRLME